MPSGITKKKRANGKAANGRKCSICNHKQTKLINKAIISGTSFRRISSEFGMSDLSVHRHTRNCLTLDLQTLQQQIKKEQAIDYNAALRLMFDHALKHQRAAAKWLQDPDDPNEFSVEPRASEIEVIYTEPVDNGKGGEKFETRRKMLRDIIDEIEDRRPDWYVQAVNINTADLRDHSLKTLDKIDMVIDKFAKTQGLYQEKQVNKLDQAADDAIRIAEMYERATGTPIAESLADLINRPDVSPELRDKLLKHPGVIEIQGEQ